MVVVVDVYALFRAELSKNIFYIVESKQRRWLKKKYVQVAFPENRTRSRDQKIVAGDFVAQSSGKLYNIIVSSKYILEGSTRLTASSASN